MPQAATKPVVYLIDPSRGRSCDGNPFMLLMRAKKAMYAAGRGSDVNTMLAMVDVERILHEPTFALTPSVYARTLAAVQRFCEVK